LLIACGGGSTAETTVVNISSLGSEMKYDVEEFTVKAGSKVKVVMKNNTPSDFMGAMLHNVVILKDESAAPMIIQLAEGNDGEPYADGRILAMTPLADKQEEMSVEFTAPTKPGKYLYVCTYIAHAGSMRGYMIVE
ncbi:MAG: plastocyanin/azurin family copper-binding protein, partial [bacterium]